MSKMGIPDLRTDIQILMLHDNFKRKVPRRIEVKHFKLVTILTSIYPTADVELLPNYTN